MVSEKYSLFEEGKEKRFEDIKNAYIELNLSPEQIAKTLKVPIELVDEIINKLQKDNLLKKVSSMRQEVEKSYRSLSVYRKKKLKQGVSIELCKFYHVSGVSIELCKFYHVSNLSSKITDSCP